MNRHATLALVQFTVARMFTGKRFAATGILLMLAPCVAALLVLVAPTQSEEAPRFFDRLTFFLSLRHILVLTAMIYGIALTSSEIEDGTAGYVMLSACPRWLVALVHVVVTAAVLTLLTTASIGLTYAVSTLSPAGPSKVGPMVVAYDALVAGIGITAYLAWFVFCGYAFRHNVAASIGSITVWEMLVPELQTRLGSMTVVMNLRILWLHLAQEGNRGRWFPSIVGYDMPTYGAASMFLSVAVALLLCLAMVAAMNRSIAGREAA